jgi:PD-(D/E)XK nuclease superfamily protein
MSALPMVTVRASALSDFLDCPARAEAKHLLHKRCPQSAAALLGTALHRSTAVFDESKLTGKGIKIGEAAAAAVDAINKPDEDVAYTEDESPHQIESIALSLHHMYCTQIAPFQEYVAVEVKCERLEITDIGLALTGTTDRVRKVDDGNGIADIKSGKTAVRADGHVETKGHRYQIGVYELLAERASGLPITEGGQVIGLQAGKTERGQRVSVSEEIRGARDVLIGEPGSPGVLEVVARMIHTGSFPGNPRSMLCGAKYCPIFETCKFRR